MTDHITDKEPPIPVNPVIPLDVAKARITSWLNLVKTIPPFGSEPAQIPRALFIATQDFESMVTECKNKYKDYEVIGVRIYFGLEPVGGVSDIVQEQLCGMMVPVLHKNNRWGHADAVYTNLADPNPNDTSIYDFTATCPDYCDPSSELYVPVP